MLKQFGSGWLDERVEKEVSSGPDLAFLHDSLSMAIYCVNVMRSHFFSPHSQLKPQASFQTCASEETNYCVHFFHSLSTFPPSINANSQSNGFVSNCLSGVACCNMKLASPLHPFSEDAQQLPAACSILTQYPAPLDAPPLIPCLQLPPPPTFPSNCLTGVSSTVYGKWNSQF